MNIRTNIFIWLFLATIVPLTALALGATYYSERVFHRDVTQTLRNNLNQLASEIQQRHHADEQFVLGLARSSAVREILSVLYDRRRGTVHREINIRRARVNRFFEGFQTILPGYFSIRILDFQGNSLIKVTHDRVSPAIYEGIEGIPLVEEELHNAAFARQLRKLPADQVSVLMLPHRDRDLGGLRDVPSFDYLVPLYKRKRLVGALTVTLLGGQIDKILEHAPRPYKGNLFLVENNTEDAERNALLLFDDRQALRLAQERKRTVKLGEHYDPALLEQLDRESDGLFRQPESRHTIYYNVFLPFSDQFFSWTLGLEIEDSLIVAPFQRIRAVIWALAGIALIITLFMANIGVRNIASPIRKLAGNLKGFADGDRTLRAQQTAALDEIATLEQAFNYMADTIEKVENERDRAQRLMLQNAKLASLGEMAAGIGHELNNPLNNILSYTKLIQRGLPEENKASRDDLDSLRDEALRASEIVKGVLNFGRQVSPHYSQFDLVEWIESTLALINQAAKGNNVSIRVLNKCPPGQTLEGDRNQLQQALINLLLNAIQASEPNAHIVVSARIDDDKCLVAVRDEGPGIDKQILDKIFDPFFSTKGEGDGTGLGLSISLGIVERHGGRLEIENNPDHGVTSTIILPLRQQTPVTKA